MIGSMPLSKAASEGSRSGASSGNLDLEAARSLRASFHDSQEVGVWGAGSFEAANHLLDVFWG